MPVPRSILDYPYTSEHLQPSYVNSFVQRWRSEGIQWFATGSGILPAWTWDESIAGNIRLLVKSAVVNSKTKEEQNYVLNRYWELEQLIQEECETRGGEYTPELCPPAMRAASIERLQRKQFHLEVLSITSWSHLGNTLRNVTLKGAIQLHPYQNANIRSALVQLDALSPIACYVQQNRLAETLELNDAFMAQYCLSLWDMAAIVHFRYNSDQIQRIAPPIIESYLETDLEPSREVHAIVDGLHRCMVARSLELDKIRVVQITDVHCPLIALPVQWEEVVTYMDPPPAHRKRQYRYATLEEVHNAAKPLGACVTKENFQYFFYRDLSALGSHGQRRFDEYQQQ